MLLIDLACYFGGYTNLVTYFLNEMSSEYSDWEVGSFLLLGGSLVSTTTEQDEDSFLYLLFGMLVREGSSTGFISTLGFSWLRI